MAERRLTLKEARETNRISEFVAQEEARRVGVTDEADFDDAIRRADQNVKHRVDHVSVVRPERKLTEIAFHVLGDDAETR